MDWFCMYAYMEYADAIKKDISNFHACVQSLRQGLASAGSGWRDKNYATVSEAVLALAKNVETVMTSGARSLELLKSFDALYHEEV